MNMSHFDDYSEGKELAQELEKYSENHFENILDKIYESIGVKQEAKEDGRRESVDFESMVPNVDFESMITPQPRRSFSKQRTRTASIRKRLIIRECGGGNAFANTSLLRISRKQTRTSSSAASSGLISPQMGNWMKKSISDFEEFELTKPKTPKKSKSHVRRSNFYNTTIL